MPTTPFNATKLLLKSLKRSGIAVTREGEAGTAFMRAGLRKIQIARPIDNPVAALIHESAHLPNSKNVGAYFARLKAQADPVAKAKATLAVERMANRDAVRGMKQAGLPLAARNSFRKMMSPNFSTYRTALAQKLVEARGVKITTDDITTTPKGEDLLQSAPLLDQGKILEKARKAQIPGYRAAKKAVSIANKGELKKSFSRPDGQPAPQRLSDVEFAALVEEGRKAATKRPLTSEELTALRELASKISVTPAPAVLAELVTLCHSGQFGLVPMSPHLREHLALAGRVAKVRNGERGVHELLAKYRVARDSRPLEVRAVELNERLDAILLDRRVNEPIDRLITATRNQVPESRLPYQEETKAAADLVSDSERGRRIRRSLWRIGRVAVRAGIGYSVGKKIDRVLGIKGSATTGAIAGAASSLFSDASTDKTIEAALVSKAQNL